MEHLKAHPHLRVWLICPPSWLCWWLDNGMQLNLLLISTLMCVIKYITTSQLANTGAIHHFNWYPPQTTWVHPRVPPVFAQWLSLRLRGRERKLSYLYFISANSPTLWRAFVCVCVYSAWLHVAAVVGFPPSAVGRRRTETQPSVMSPMMPMFSVYWMVMRTGMQIQSRPAHFVPALTLNKP